MVHVELKGDESYFERIKFPESNDMWGAKIGKLSKLPHVIIASCVSPALYSLQSYPIIIVFPDTTRQDIMDDWKQISEYRTELNRVQGVGSMETIELHQTVYRLHDEFKMSYLEIARFLNFEILVALFAGLRLGEDGGTVQDKILIFNFRKILIDYGNTIVEVQAIQDAATTKLIRGKLPWNLDRGPFTPEKIREMVRYFESLVTTQNFIIDLRRDYLLIFVHLNNARELVRSYYRKQYKVGKKEEKLFQKWNQMVSMICKDLEKYTKLFVPNIKGMG